MSKKKKKKEKETLGACTSQIPNPRTQSFPAHLWEKPVFLPPGARLQHLTCDEHGFVAHGQQRPAAQVRGGDEARGAEHQQPPAGAQHGHAQQPQRGGQEAPDQHLCFLHRAPLGRAEHSHPKKHGDSHAEPSKGAASKSIHRQWWEAGAGSPPPAG